MAIALTKNRIGSPHFIMVIKLFTTLSYARPIRKAVRIKGKNYFTMLIIYINYEEPCHTVITEIDAWFSLMQMEQRARVKAIEELMRRAMEDSITLLPADPDLG